MMQRRLLSVLCLGILVLKTGCAGPEPTTEEATPPADSPTVAVVCYAHEYLVRRLAADHVDVLFPAADAINPATWRPDVDQIQRLQSVDLIILNGPGAVYAQWLPRVTLPDSRMCRASEELPLSDFIAIDDYRIVHQHGPEGEHSHAYMVPFTWLDPSVAARQTTKMCQCLCERWPEHAREFQKKLAALNDDLETLSQAMQGLLKDETVITATPQLKYLTRALGANDRHLLWFDMPNRDSWKATEKQKLDDVLEQTKATLMLTPVPLPDFINDHLAQRNVRVVQVELLDRRPNATEPSTGDYLSTMTDLVEKIHQTKTAE